MTYREKVKFYASTQDTHYDSYVHLPKIMAFDIGDSDMDMGAKAANFVFMCRFAIAHWEFDLSILSLSTQEGSIFPLTTCHTGK